MLAPKSPDPQHGRLAKHLLDIVVRELAGEAARASLLEVASALLARRRALVGLASVVSSGAGGGGAAPAAHAALEKDKAHAANLKRVTAELAQYKVEGIGANTPVSLAAPAAEPTLRPLPAGAGYRAAATLGVGEPWKARVPDTAKRLLAAVVDALLAEEAYSYSYSYSCSYAYSSSHLHAYSYS